MVSLLADGNLSSKELEPGNAPAGECLTPPLANHLVAERAFRASEFWGLTRVSEVHGK